MVTSNAERIIIPRKNRLYMSMMNKGSIECGMAGTIKKTDVKANKNDKTEKP
jgi:hypothetical protein